MDPDEPEFADRLSAFPRRADFVFTPEAYLDHVRRLKASVGIPVLASLNGTSSASWFSFGQQLEQAGADGLEINLYNLVSEPGASSAAIERRLCDVAGELVRTLRIPVAAKLSPYYTTLGNLAADLDAVGVHGLVLFNRLYQADIDIDRLEPVPDVSLSTSHDLLLRLRWIAMLHGRVRASLAASGGIATPQDGVKAILAGTDVIQQVSALLRHGHSYIGTMRRGLEEWLDAHGLASVDAARGLVSLQHQRDTSAFERGTYLRMLQTSGPLLS
jgi:dihydroorotate dehydrogenase (fumarate)